MLQLKSTGTGMEVGHGVAVGVGTGVEVGANVGAKVGVSVGVGVGCVTEEDGSELANEPLKKAMKSDATIIKPKIVTKRNLEFRDTFGTPSVVL